MNKILLDTVTVSEIRRGPKGNANVWKWQQGFRSASLSVISLNEILYGIHKVEPKDPRFATILTEWYDTIISRPSHYRILGIDRAIAEESARYRAQFGTQLADSLIAATAKIHGLTLATRNTADFMALGISVVNPWEYGV
jgi:predicted nucleic acid-binding protein